MADITLAADTNGVIVRALLGDATDAAMGAAPHPDAVSALTFDGDANPEVLAALRRSTDPYRLSADGLLTRDGAAVPIAAPAPPPTLAEQLGGALAALPADQPITGGQLAEVIALLRGPQS